MTTVRNVAIIAVLALVVAAVPGGGNLANGILAAISVGFLAAIGASGVVMYRQNQFAYMALTERDRWILLGAVGAIVLMIAGADELLGDGLGVLVWFGVLAASGFAIYRVVMDTRSL